MRKRQILGLKLPINWLCQRMTLFLIFNSRNWNHNTNKNFDHDLLLLMDTWNNHNFLWHRFTGTSYLYCFDSMPMNANEMKNEERTKNVRKRGKREIVKMFLMRHTENKKSTAKEPVGEKHSAPAERLKPGWKGMWARFEDVERTQKGHFGGKDIQEIRSGDRWWSTAKLAILLAPAPVPATNIRRLALLLKVSRV